MRASGIASTGLSERSLEGRNTSECGGIWGSRLNVKDGNIPLWKVDHLVRVLRGAYSGSFSLKALGCSGLGFRVWGLGFGVWGLGFGAWGLGFGV